MFLIVEMPPTKLYSHKTMYLASWPFLIIKEIFYAETKFVKTMSQKQCSKKWPTLYLTQKKLCSNKTGLSFLILVSEAESDKIIQNLIITFIDCTGWQNQAQMNGFLYCTKRNMHCIIFLSTFLLLFSEARSFAIEKVTRRQSDSNCQSPPPRLLIPPFPVSR